MLLIVITKVFKYDKFKSYENKDKPFIHLLFIGVKRNVKLAK